MAGFEEPTGKHAHGHRPHDSWLHQNRHLVVVGLIFLLAYGFWSVRFMILDDFPRMEPWQKVLFWLGDLGALVYAVRWMMSRDDAEDVRPHVRDQSTTVPQKIAVVVAVSLILDMVVTVIAMVNSYQSMDRAVLTKATVVSSTESPFRNHITYYRLTVEYQDERGKPYSVGLNSKSSRVVASRIGNWIRCKPY